MNSPEGRAAVGESCQVDLPQSFLPGVSMLAHFRDLMSLRSSDRRLEDEAGNIWEHRVITSNWSDNWVFLTLKS